MDINFEEICRSASARLLSAPLPTMPIQGISTDTRTIQANDVFVALKGAKFDAHDFLQEAFEKGASFFIISDEKKAGAELLRKANVALVEDTLKAYGDIAANYRKKFKIPVAGITGSSGKTTVKELLSAILETHFQNLKNKGTENNLIGVPKTLLRLNASYQSAVIEMGTSLPGEIERLSQIVSPQIGILTQIGYSHLEGLKDLDGVFKEKTSLLKHLQNGGFLIVNGEDKRLKNLKPGAHPVLRVGFETGLEYMIDQVCLHEKGCAFRLGGMAYDTPLLGRHNVLNCGLAIVAALKLGVPAEKIQSTIAAFRPVPGRLQLKELGDILFIDDTYNANPTSFRAALETLKEFKARDKKALVCGDMLELGSHSERLHREMGLYAASLNLDCLIACGEASRFLVDEAVKSGFNASKIFHAASSVEAAAVCREKLNGRQVVLVKGSRGMKMEKIFECFMNLSIR